MNLMLLVAETYAFKHIRAFHPDLTEFANPNFLTALGGHKFLCHIWYQFAYRANVRKAILPRLPPMLNFPIQKISFEV